MQFLKLCFLSALLIIFHYGAAYFTEICPAGKGYHIFSTHHTFMIQGQSDITLHLQPDLGDQQALPPRTLDVVPPPNILELHPPQKISELDSSEGQRKLSSYNICTVIQI